MFAQLLLIPISVNCCRKIRREKWKINPFFQFCSWHFPAFQQNKKIGQLKGEDRNRKKSNFPNLPPPFGSTIKLYKLWQNIQNVKLFWGHPEGGKYLVWFVGSGWWWYDDTWRLSSRARHRDYFCCSPFSLSAGIQSQCTALFIKYWF